MATPYSQAPSSSPTDQADASDWLVTFSGEAASTVDRLATTTGLTTSELLQSALTLLEIIARAAERNQKVLVTSPTGYPIREIRLPNAS